MQHSKNRKWLMKTDWCSVTVKWQQYMFAAIGIQVSVSENLFQVNMLEKNDLCKRIYYCMLKMYWSLKIKKYQKMKEQFSLLLATKNQINFPE